MSDPTLAICGLLCLYPLIFWAIPAYLIGRYRLHWRLPVTFDEREQERGNVAAPKPVGKRPADSVGYGSPK